MESLPSRGRGGNWHPGAPVGADRGVVGAAGGGRQLAFVAGAPGSASIWCSDQLAGVIVGSARPGEVARGSGKRPYGR